MSARKKLLAIVEKGNYGPNVMEFCDGIVELVKEELCSGSQRWEVVADFMKEKEPELIQDYTAEQWQEIKDGEYLCEFTYSNDVDGMPRFGLLNKFEDDPSATEDVFQDDAGEWHDKCRPAQIKGVLRPIWVEPGDAGVMCAFFKDGYPLNNRMSRASYAIYQIGDFPDATSYMEI